VVVDGHAYRANRRPWRAVTLARVTGEEAERLLELARAARWTFPSSFGRPARAGETVDRFAAERDRLVEAAGVLDEEAGVELAAHAWRVWVYAGDVAGGRAFLATVLHRAVRPSRALALALYGDGLLALREGAVAESRARNQAALDAALAVGDPEALALAHLGLSRVAFEDGDYVPALAQAQAAREHSRDLQPALGQGPLHTEAQSTRMLGDLDRAAELLAQSLALNRRIGDTGMVAVELHNLGHVEIRRGNLEAAERILDELGVGDDAHGTLSSAALAHARGDDHRARELLARAELVRSELAADDRAELNWLRQRLRQAQEPGELSRG
jgi:tetratricopeptide (TPR) repeat protein